MACVPLLVAATASGASVAAGGPLAVSIDATRPGAVIPSNFLGLSFETTVLTSPAITTTSPQLVRLLGNLGAGELRVSGDSVDHTQWMPAPATRAPWAAATITPGDLGNLKALAGATGWRVNLGLNLGHPDASSVADEARMATSILGPSLGALAIGNEPDLFARPPSAPFQAALGTTPLRTPAWGLSSYLNQWTTLRGAISGAGVSAPEYGPETASGKWLAGYAAGAAPGVTALTQHFYPLDRCRLGRLTARAPSLPSLLTRHVAAHETTLMRAAVRVAASHHLPLRIDEANSIACGGQPKVSDTFASALWAVDFSLLAARQGAVGLNFHGGLGSCQRGGTLLSPWYSPLCALSTGQLHARPEYYALLLLRSLEGGAFVPVSFHTAHNLSVYALRAPDGTLRVLVDDMDTATTAAHGRPAVPARTVSVSLNAGSAFGHASVARLTAPRVDSTQGITLGGATVAGDGSLLGGAPQSLPGASGRFTLAVRPASAALVTLSR